MNTKEELLQGGIELVKRFCAANGWTVPTIDVLRDRWHVRHCAYYRADRIVIHPPSCAHIGTGGQAWSFPGYVIDRTPYGVMAHELGHHADVVTGTALDLATLAYSSEFSTAARVKSGEEKLTNYCPNDAEWFAELFRLFVTNPDLLRVIRPRTHALFCEHYQPVELRPWRDVLATAAARNIEQCLRRIAQADARQPTEEQTSLL